jgi:hypothetical protein
MLANGAPTATTTATPSNSETNHNFSPESIRQLTFSNSTLSGLRTIDLKPAQFTTPVLSLLLVHFQSSHA